MTSQKPADLALSFLCGLAQGRIDEALAQVDEGIVYSNVGLPTIRGIARFTPVMRLLNGRWISLDAQILSIAANDDGVVLTERIDEMSFGPLQIRFWVCGHIEVAEGRITVVRDYFDFWDCTKALWRAVAGLAVPRLNRRPLVNPVSAYNVTAG